MSITINNAKVREVIKQVINDPAYKQVSEVPLLSVYQIGLIVLAYAGFIGGILLNLYLDVSIWLVLPMMILSSYMAFTPLHDATHRAVSANKFLNDLLGSISGSLLFPFMTTAAYRFLHLTHHRYVGDDDLDPDSILVAIPTRYFPFGYLILPVFDFAWVYWAFTKGWHRMPGRVRSWFFFSVTGFIAFYAVGLASPYWLEFTMLYIIPSRLGMAYTAYTFAHIQHPDGVKWDEFPFESTHVLKGHKSSFLLKSLLGQEQHAMHHFLPHIPWYKYHRVWELGNGIFSKQPIPERNFLAIPDKHALEKIRSSRENEVSSLRVRIAEIIDAAEEIKSFVLEPLDADELLPDFSAGSHVDVHLPSGKKRSYSLVNPPHERKRYQIAVKREANGKGGSREMHELKEGDIITISLPRNNFLLYENTRRFILIAGGIGLTPLISMAHRLEELDKPFELHICTHSENHVPFRYELKNWSFAPMVEVHVDREGKPSIELDKVLAGAEKDALVYVCGPAGFNNWVKETAVGMGWNADQVKQELFGANAINTTPPKPFEVELKKTGVTVEVPENLSIIDAVEMHNVDIDYSCLQGTCGTCITKVLEGSVDHRDAVLTEEEKLENTQICLCVSRSANGKLVLDL